MATAKDWIDGLQLLRHPEGGYFREVYRAAETIAREHLPPRFTGDRAFATSIYFLLQGEDFSAFHRIKQDEIWHFYDGTSLTIFILAPDGALSTIRLGRNLQAGEVLQGVVEAGCYFAAQVNDADSFALVGCTVAPGFNFADFEMPSRQELIQQFPKQQEIIHRLTRS